MARKKYSKYNPKSNATARARFARWSRNPARDISRKARMATSIKNYDPNVNDWKGVDTPGSRMPANAWANRRPRKRKRTYTKRKRSTGPRKATTKRPRRTATSTSSAYAGARSAWIAHVRATKATMPGAPYKQVLKAASATYIKRGNDPFTNFMAAGGNMDTVNSSGWNYALEGNNKVLPSVPMNPPSATGFFGGGAKF